ncbi:MAG TPA: anti-sigma factor [Mycobacteriales bacterium]|nr:anti-sigma factor [Mycobacteriales bacterium]
MSGASHDDAHWAELAAGYALHALEPDDEAIFTSHLAGCQTCQQTLDDHSLVAAQLASLADDAATAAPPWSRIRPVIATAPDRSESRQPQPSPAPPADGVVLQMRRRHARLLAAAAAVVGLIGIGVAGWQVTSRSHGSGGVPSAVAACKSSPGCHVVRLLAEGKVEAGDVLVRGGSASVVPTAMPALDASHVYVLWQMPRDGRPTPVTALPDIATSKAGRSVSLAIPYDDTAAFAMSVERADQVPTQPTKVVAVGTAT